MQNENGKTLAVHHVGSQFRLGAQRHNVPKPSKNSLDITRLRVGNSCYSNSYYRDTTKQTSKPTTHITINRQSQLTIYCQYQVLITTCFGLVTHLQVIYKNTASFGG